MSIQTIQRLLSDKADPGRTVLQTVDIPYSLSDGDVILQIGQVAITTNNITYAAFGDAMDYWQFFPTGQDEFGQMPVWGFADVVTSETIGLDVGERIYGYFPLASHLLIRPNRVSSRGFYDNALHRQELVSAYNQYTRCSNDSGYQHGMENYQALVRPLFITSYVLTDFLADNLVFGAKQLIFSSASSKTAYGAAYCVKSMLPDCPVIALTSVRNVPFVESLGLYDQVVSYDDVETLTNEISTTYVDFAGNAMLRERIHKRFGSNLSYDCFVGSTHNSGFPQGSKLPGPKPIFFFAPNQIEKRNRDYGPAEFTKRFSAAQVKFIEKLGEVSPPWMTIVEHCGYKAAATLVGKLAEGTSDPDTGNIVIL